MDRRPAPDRAARRGRGHHLPRRPLQCQQRAGGRLLDVGAVDRARSVVDRPRSDRQTLEANSEALFAVELVGYLFFGSIRRVTDLVEPSLESGTLRYLIMDFSAVRGLDASVVSGLQTIQRRTAEAGVEMICSGLDEAFAKVVSESEGGGPSAR